MKISEIFNLGKQQPELDFVDIDTETDTPLFLDPYFLSNRIDPWSRIASETIRDFFQTLIDSIRNNESDALLLLANLHEPNETCLGLSRGSPQGRGVGQDDSRRLFQSLSQSRAVQTGVVEDLQDCHIFVDGIGKDKLSDMTTAIIRKFLIEYTQQQARINGLPLQPGIPSGSCWNPSLGRWDTQYENMLIVNGQRIILVPNTTTLRTP